MFRLRIYLDVLRCDFQKLGWFLKAADARDANIRYDISHDAKKMLKIVDCVRGLSLLCPFALPCDAV